MPHSPVSDPGVPTNEELQIAIDVYSLLFHETTSSAPDVRHFDLILGRSGVRVTASDFRGRRH